MRFAYYYEDYNNNVGLAVDEEDFDEEWTNLDMSSRVKVPGDIIDPMPHAKLVDSAIDVDGDPNADSDILNDTIAQQTHRNELRAGSQYHIPRDTKFWGPSQVSLPKDSIWGSPNSHSFDPAKPDDKKYTYNYDIADASNTFVYVIHDQGVWTDHVVSSL